ncbi:MAG: universal stress protein [Bacteroidetes bacterium]|nr:universal stress protein [Bacteroidota bacterium]
MKNILVPTDFSENAEYAVRYATELAAAWQAKVILMHAFQVTYASGYVPYEEIAAEKKLIQKESEEKLKTMAHALTKAHVAHQVLCVDDIAVEAILNAIREHHIELVVMGTKGASSMANVIFGSNTSHVIQRATCPVLAIPEGTTYKKPKTLTYAAAYETGDIDIIKKLADMAKPFHAQLNVLHITENSDDPAKDKADMKKFMDLVTEKIDCNNISFQVMNGITMENVLEDYVNQDAADILILSTHQRGFFGRVFGNSVTRQMSYHSRIPLMAFHFLKDSSVKLF